MALEYVVGALIPGTTNPWLHMTICVIQEPRFGSQVLRDTMELAKAVLPLPVTFGARAMFGRDQTIPVRLIEVDDAHKKEQLDAFYRTYFAPLPGEEGRLTQRFHVSVKKLSGEEADALTACALPVMFLKVVGVDQFLWRSDA